MRIEFDLGTWLLPGAEWRVDAVRQTRSRDPRYRFRYRLAALIGARVVGRCEKSQRVIKSKVEVTE